MHSLAVLATTLLLPALNAAQNYGNSGSKSSSSSGAGTSTSSAAAGVHTVAVGKSGLSFSPNSLTAAVGDQIEFHFDSPTHSVAQGDFSNACQPSSNASAFWSGFPKDGSPPFTITVNDTQPIWFYCAQVGHCQAGMVGVINPPSGGSQTLDAYTSAAGKASNTKAPSNIQGGVFALAQAAAASGSSSGTAPASQPTTGGAGQMDRSAAMGLAGVVAVLGGAFVGL